MGKNIYRIKKGKGFIYVDEKKNQIKEKKILDRIKKIVIPPAWNPVVISSDPKADIQVIGKDEKGRAQYIYHPDWVKQKELEKFTITMVKFGKKIGQIRKDINDMLKIKMWNYEKTLGFVLYIIDKCHLRVGNKKYKDENESYGITTLERRHIKIGKDIVSFKFKGKKGVINECSFTDQKTINLFKDYDKKMGTHKNNNFFVYKKEKELRNITSNDINEFLKKYGDFSAKCFRTWSANEILLMNLYGIEPTSKITHIKRNLNQCLDCVAIELNNTRAICKKNYICGFILKYYEENKENFKRTMDRYISRPYKNNNPLESALIHFLELYNQSK